MERDEALQKLREIERWMIKAEKEIYSNINELGYNIKTILNYMPSL